MLEYSGEFLTSVIKRSKVLFGLTLDLLAAAALAFANLSAFRVWWPLLVLVALLLVLFASFQAFQEVRRKIAPSIDVRVTLQEFGAPMIVIYADGSLQFYAPLGFRFRNNGDVARIAGLRLLWERQPILGGPKAVHVIPLRRDDQSRPFSLEMGKAAVVEKEFLFEGRRASDGKGAGGLPRKSRLVLDVDVVGQPSFVVPLVVYEVERWELPPTGYNNSIRPTRLLPHIEA
jgi:hypothetical protein